MEPFRSRAGEEGTAQFDRPLPHCREADTGIPRIGDRPVIIEAGLIVLALGCVAVSASLLKMGNDEFDLPPLTRG